MKETSREHRVTLHAAAKALGVSKGTVIHYLNSGQLTRVREGSQVYILMDEIKALGDGDVGSGEVMALQDKDRDSEFPAPASSSGEGDGITVNLERDHYEQLLTRIGQLKSEKQNLLKYRENMVDTKAALSQKEKDLQEAEAKLHMMEEELRRLKKMGWWKRVFGRGWRMTGG